MLNQFTRTDGAGSHPIGFGHLVKSGYLSDSERENAIDLMNEETLALDKVIRGLSALINEVQEY